MYPPRPIIATCGYKSRFLQNANSRESEERWYTRSYAILRIVDYDDKHVVTVIDGDGRERKKNADLRGQYD